MALRNRKVKQSEWKVANLLKHWPDSYFSLLCDHFLNTLLSKKYVYMYWYEESAE